MTAPKQRPRRLARIVRRLLALVVILILFVLLWLHTGWGRAFVKDTIIEETNSSIPGSLVIKELEGSVLGTPTLRGLRLQGPEGGDILKIEQLDIDMSLLDLLADRVNLANLQIHGLQLDLRQDAEGNLNLLESLIDPDQKEEKDGWPLALENIEVLGGSIRFTDRNATTHILEDLKVEGTSVHVAGDSTSLRIGSIEATIGFCGGLPLRASGSIDISPEGITSKKLELRSGDSHVVVEGLKYSQDGQSLEAVVAGSAAPELLQCLLPEQQWLQAVAFSGHALRPDGAAQIGFGLTINDGMLELQKGMLAADLSSGGGTLAIKELRPNKLVAMEIASFAEGSLELGFRAHSGTNVDVDLSGALKISAGDYDAEIPKLEFHSTAKLAQVEITAEAYGASLEGSATLDGLGEEVVITTSSLTGTFPDLAKLPIPLSLAGSAQLIEASAVGPVGSLKAEGKLKGQDLRLDKSRAKSAALAFRFDDLPSKLTGRVEANLSAVRQGRDRIGPVYAEIDSDAEGQVFDLRVRAGQTQRIYANLDAQAHLGPGKTEVLLQRARLRHKSLSAQLRTGPEVKPKLTIWRDGDVTVEQVRLGIGRGSIAVEGSLRRELNAKLRGIEIAPFLPLVPSIGVPLTGSVGGSATIRMTDQGVHADASLEMPALRLSEGGEPLDLKVVGRFSPKEIGAAVELRSVDKGSVRFDAKMRPPKGNWTHAATRLLRASNITFDEFDLRLLRPLHQELRTLAGHLDGKLRIGAGVKRIDGELHASEVAHKLWDSTRDADLEIHATQQRASVQLDASDSKVGSVTLTLDLRPPGPLHSPWRWPLSLAGVVHDSDLRFMNINVVELVDAVPALQAINVPIGGGTVSGTVELREQGRLVRLQSTATDFQVAGRPKISANLLSTFTPDKATADWEVKLNAANKLRGSGQIDTGITILKDHKHLDRLLARIQKARIQADVSLQASSPKLLADLAGLEQQIDANGNIDATAKFDGSTEKPGGSADITIAGAQIEGVPIEKVTLHGELEGRDASGSLQVYQDKDRFLRASADIDVDKLEMRQGQIEAKEIDLRILRVLDKGQGSPLAAIAGVANGTIGLTGNVANITPTGSMRIRKGAIDLGGSLMPLVGVSIEIKAAKRRLTLSGKARSGSGRIALSGQAKVVPGGIEDFGLRLRSTRLPVVVANLVCSVDIDSHSQISWRPGVLNIKTNIDTGVVRIPIRSFLGKTRQLHNIDGMGDLVYISPRVGKEEPTDIETGFKVRIQIRAKESVVVKTRELLAKVDLDLDTTLVNGAFVTLGGARVVSGHVDLFERRYNIDKASAKFHARVPMNPSFNLRLSHEFDQLLLSILAQGSLDKPSLSFVADPSDYDQATLLAIVLGQAPADDENQEGLHDNALTTISTLAANQLQDLLAPVLPFAPDVMRVEKTDNDGELYITGHWINDDWFVAYHHRTLAEDQENENEAESKYKLSKAWTLEAVLGDQAGGMDVLWTKRWGK